MKITVNDNEVKFGNFVIESRVRGYKHFKNEEKEYSMLLRFNTNKELDSYEKEKVIQKIRSVLNFEANNDMSQAIIEKKKQ